MGNYIEACNGQFEIRCDDLEISQQDQLVQLIEFIDEIKQFVVNNHHLSSSLPPAISSSIPPVTHDNNLLTANLRSR